MPKKEKEGITKDGSKGSKYVCFIDEKLKKEKSKDEPFHKLTITEIHQKVHILEAPSKSIDMITTLNLTTKVHAMAIQPYNGENNAALQQIVSAIAFSIINTRVLSST